MKTLAMVLLLAAALFPGSTHAESPEADLEQLRQAFLKLQRDLVILEEDLLFPPNSQVAVYLSMDVGEFFALDAVTVKVNNEEVVHHLYTERQLDALLRGGVQRLYLGNLRQGQHRLTATFVGRGPQGREYRRATTVVFEKSFDPAFIELAIRDSESKYQPEFFALVNQ